MLHIVPLPQTYHAFLHALVIIKMTLQSSNWIFWFILAQILLHWPQRFQFTDVLRRDQRVPHVEDRRTLLVVTHEMTSCPMTAWFKKPLTLPQARASSLTFILLPISALMSHTIYGHQFARWSLVALRSTPIKLTGLEIKHVIKNKQCLEDETIHHKGKYPLHRIKVGKYSLFQTQ